MSWSLTHRRVWLAAVVWLACAGASSAQTFPPFPEEGRDKGIYAPDLSDLSNKYQTKLLDEWKMCQRGAFNHDLQNYAALADIAQHRENAARGQEIQKLQASGRFGAAGALEKELDRQRSTTSPYGQSYSDSVHINKWVVWFRSLTWGHCLPPQTSMIAPPPGGSEQVAAGPPATNTGGVLTQSVINSPLAVRAGPAARPNPRGDEAAGVQGSQGGSGKPEQ